MMTTNKPGFSDDSLAPSAAKALTKLSRPCGKAITEHCPVTLRKLYDTYTRLLPADDLFASPPKWRADLVEALATIANQYESLSDSNEGVTALLGTMHTRIAGAVNWIPQCTTPEQFEAVLSILAEELRMVEVTCRVVDRSEGGSPLGSISEFVHQFSTILEQLCSTTAWNMTPSSFAVLRVRSTMWMVVSPCVPDGRFVRQHQTICHIYKHLLLSAREHVSPLVPRILRQLEQAYQQHHVEAALATMGNYVVQYCHRTAGETQETAVLAGAVVSSFRAFLQVAEREPNEVVEMFGLLATTVSRAPGELAASGCLPSAFDLALSYLASASLPVRRAASSSSEIEWVLMAWPRAARTSWREQVPGGRSGRTAAPVLCETLARPRQLAGGVCRRCHERRRLVLAPEPPLRGRRLARHRGRQPCSHSGLDQGTHGIEARRLDRSQPAQDLRDEALHGTVGDAHQLRQAAARDFDLVPRPGRLRQCIGAVRRK